MHAPLQARRGVVSRRAPAPAAPPASPPSAAPHRVEKWPVERPRERGEPSNFSNHIYMLDNMYISLVMRDRFPAPPASPGGAAPHRFKSWPVERPRERGEPSKLSN